jgi:hypothetical protein
VLPILVCVVWWTGSVLYGNWIEYKRINDLTQKYGGEIFESVKAFESRNTLNGYLGKDKYCEYVVLNRLEACKKTWDALNNGEIQNVRVAVTLSSPQVVLYTGNTAELAVELHRKEVKYGTSGPEVIDQTDQALMALYYMEKEQNVWKVALIDVCGLHDRKCVRYLKHIEEKWYHID